MADDISPRHGQDRHRIDVDDQEDIRYWTERLGVTEEELRNAVHTAGIQIDDIRRHLGKMSGR